ncbi:MAG: PH domain-containing protein [Ruminococcaceae bacterium]|nr:PH domain-containing protein [Oscillospiraceae bacterium]
MAKKDFSAYVWTDKKRPLFGLPLSFTRYKLTEERLLIETGFLSKKEEEIRLYRIMDLTLLRPLGQRIFKLGTIHCCTADKSTPEFDVLKVKDAEKVRDLLSELVEKQREAKRVSGREFMDDDVDHETL